MKIIKIVKYYFHILSLIIANTKNISKQNNYYVLHLKNKSSFCLRNIMDLWTLAETYLNQDYEKNGIEIGHDWTIVDIGAAFGDFSIFAAQKSSHNKVLAIEPLPSSLNLLSQNIKNNHLQNIQVFSGAISSTKKKICISENKTNYGNSQTSSKSSIKVTSLSLGEIFKKYNLTHCNLIKCDCEGSEYDIFLSINPEFFKSIDNIVMEYHLFDFSSIDKFNQLKSFFIKNGFKLKITPNPVHSYIGFLSASRKN